MAIPRVLKNFNLFVDGIGKAGLCDSVQLPTLALQMEEHRAGGMDAPVELDMGMEKLEMSFTLSDPDERVLALFGFSTGGGIQATFRAAYQADGLAVTPYIVHAHGVIKKMEPSETKLGEKATQKFELGVRYLRIISAGLDLVEIDVENMVRRVGGVDQLALIRAAIGA